MLRISLMAGCLLALVGCGSPTKTNVESASGVKMATVGALDLDDAGRTVEQVNCIDRIKADNTPGSMKHLYVISAYSGQTILYSPVRGKVTSGGKRLTPSKIDGTAAGENRPYIVVGGKTVYVSELPNEDGTFGSGSSDYLFWFTPDGRYHQHYLSGGQIVHVSDEPIAVKGVLITIDSGVKK